MFQQDRIFDGLGRPWLTQDQQPDGTYLTSLSEFDIMDRPLRKWVSVAMSSTNPLAEDIKTQQSVITEMTIHTHPTPTSHHSEHFLLPQSAPAAHGTMRTNLHK